MNFKTETSDKVLGTVVGYTQEEGVRSKPIWSITKEIKVKIIDWNKVLVKLATKLPPLEQMKRYKIRSGSGIIFIPNEDTLVPTLIDDECCGVEGETRNMFLNGECICTTIIQGIGVFVESENGISMFPKYYIDFDMEDIEKAYTGEEKELWEYMGSRYEYNPRITNNMREIAKLYKGIRTKD